ncbi:MAG: LuxR C-terminal-related transcriptional regulator [Anaerolineales bacterium]
MNELINALGNAADGAFVVNEKLEIVYANPAAQEFLDFHTDNGLSINCYRVLQGHDDENRLVCHEYCQVAKMILSERQVSSFDLRTVKREQDLWINLSVFRYVARAGDQPYIIHLFRDTSQKKNDSRLVQRLLQVAKQYHGIDSEPFSGEHATQDHETLTPREAEVLDLLAEGYSTRRIANVLSISVNTARNHIQNILQKLNVHSRLEAVIYAIDHELFDQNE